VAATAAQAFLDREKLSAPHKSYKLEPRTAAASSRPSRRRCPVADLR